MSGLQIARDFRCVGIIIWNRGREARHGGGPEFNCFDVLVQPFDRIGQPLCQVFLQGLGHLGSPTCGLIRHNSFS